MRILIVDDSKSKTVWIKEELEQQGIKYDEVIYLNKAYQNILSYSYDGIILDMQFPTLKNTTVKKRQGENLLRWLKTKKINIPVLGNSIMDFPDSKEYPFLKGKLNGYKTMNERKILLEFLENIKEGS